MLTWDCPGRRQRHAATASTRSDGSGHIWETIACMDDRYMSNTSYTDGGLTAADTRWYRVFAVNDHGVGSGIQSGLEGTTRHTRSTPDSVRNLRAVPNTKNPAALAST